MAQRVGMGGPKFAEPAYTGGNWWGDNGKLRREHVLDSYSQHTAKCTACSKVAISSIPSTFFIVELYPGNSVDSRQLWSIASVDLTDQSQPPSPLFFALCTQD